MSGSSESGKQESGYGSAPRCEGPSWGYPTPGLGKGLLNWCPHPWPDQDANTPQVSTQEVSQASCAPALHACLQRGRVWDVLLLPESSKLFHSLSRPSRVPGAPVPGFSPPRAWRVSTLSGSSNPRQTPSLSLCSPDTARLWGGGRANGGTAPNRLPGQPSRAGGLLGRLHLLFLKRRGADERHHWSPGPSHRHTQRPELRSRSTSRGGGSSGRGGATKVHWVPGSPAAKCPPPSPWLRATSPVTLTSVCPSRPGSKSLGGPQSYPWRRSQSQPKAPAAQKQRGAAVAFMAHSPVAVRVPGMQVRKPRPPPGTHVTAWARSASGTGVQKRPQGSPEGRAGALARWPANWAQSVVWCSGSAVHRAGKAGKDWGACRCRDGGRL